MEKSKFKKQFIVEFSISKETGTHMLFVGDPEKIQENGNIAIVQCYGNAYADAMLKELTEGNYAPEGLELSSAVTVKFDDSHYNTGEK